MCIPPIPRRALPSLLAAFLLSACAGGGGEGPWLPAGPPPPPPFVELIPLQRDAPLDGAMVEGGNGDWLIRNERLSVVVGGQGGSAGRVLDAAPAGGMDLLDDVTVAAGGAPLVVESVAPLAAPDSLSRVLGVRARSAGIPGLQVATRYRLRAGSDVVEITTVAVNAGDSLLTGLDLGDAIAWGRAGEWAPGTGRLPAGWTGSMPLVVGEGEGTAYGLRSRGGDLAGDKEGGSLRTVAATVSLAPGDTAVVRRELAVVRGSAAEVLEVFWGEEGRPVARVGVRAVDGADGPVAGAEVVALDPERGPVSWGRTGPDGRLTLPVPPDRRLRLEGRASRRGPARGAHEVRLAAGTWKTAEFRFDDPATLTLAATDPGGRALPARWVFEGVGGTPDPDLGPAYRPDGSGRCVLTASAAEAFPVPPGRYRITAVAGPGYETWTGEVDLTRGRSVRVDALLEPVPLPGGWVPVDPYPRSRAGGVGTVTLADRLRALASEGIRGALVPRAERLANAAAVPPVPVGVFSIPAPGRALWTAGGGDCPRQAGRRGWPGCPGIVRTSSWPARPWAPSSPTGFRCPAPTSTSAR